MSNLWVFIFKYQILAAAIPPSLEGWWWWWWWGFGEGLSGPIFSQHFVRSNLPLFVILNKHSRGFDCSARWSSNCTSSWTKQRRKKMRHRPSSPLLAPLPSSTHIMELDGWGLHWPLVFSYFIRGVRDNSCPATCMSHAPEGPRLGPAQVWLCSLLKSWFSFLSFLFFSAHWREKKNPQRRK